MGEVGLRRCEILLSDYMSGIQPAAFRSLPSSVPRPNLGAVAAVLAQNHNVIDTLFADEGEIIPGTSVGALSVLPEGASGAGEMMQVLHDHRPAGFAQWIWHQMDEFHTRVELEGLSDPSTDTWNDPMSVEGWGVYLFGSQVGMLQGELAENVQDATYMQVLFQALSAGRAGRSNLKRILPRYASTNLRLTSGGPVDAAICLPPNNVGQASLEVSFLPFSPEREREREQVVRLGALPNQPTGVIAKIRSQLGL